MRSEYAGIQLEYFAIKMAFHILPRWESMRNVPLLPVIQVGAPSVEGSETDDHASHSSMTIIATTTP